MAKGQGADPEAGRIIDGNFLVPLSVVGVVAGGIMWLTSLHANVSDTAERMDHMDTASLTMQTKIYDELKELNRRLSRIEGKIDK